MNFLVRRIWSLSSGDTLFLTYSVWNLVLSTDESSPEVASIWYAPTTSTSISLPSQEVFTVT